MVPLDQGAWNQSGMRACRGGFQTRPLSAETGREILSGLSAHRAGLFATTPPSFLTISAQPPGPRLLREGGFETRPYKRPAMNVVPQSPFVGRSLPRREDRRLL